MQASRRAAKCSLELRRLFRLREIGSHFCAERNFFVLGLFPMAFLHEITPCVELLGAFIVAQMKTSFNQ